MKTLSWLYGESPASGVIKQTPDDFVVIEDLGYQPDGDGEHILVKLRKIGCNTQFAAQQLAKFAGISAKAVSYAGLKDRHAITEQWFCLHMPGKITLDFNQFQCEGCSVIHFSRHRRKLRIGNLKSNYFQLVIRQISDKNSVETRLQQIKESGVPNYFGEQRFGHNGNNLIQAEKWAKGEINVKERQKRSFYLSAIRSALFNYATSNRLSQDLSSRILPGDALQLAGKGSWFVAQAEELEQLQQRLAINDIYITAPLPGCDDLGTQETALAFEKSQLIGYEDFIALLCKERVESARRAIVVIPQHLDWQWLNEETVRLNFSLPPGSFATSVVRELITISAACSTSISD